MTEVNQKQADKIKPNDKLLVSVRKHCCMERKDQ